MSQKTKTYDHYTNAGYLMGVVFTLNVDFVFAMAVHLSNPELNDLQVLQRNYVMVGIAIVVLITNYIISHSDLRHEIERFMADSTDEQRAAQKRSLEYWIALSFIFPIAVWFGSLGFDFR